YVRLILLSPRAEAEQSDVVAKRCRDLCFCHGLWRSSHDASNHDRTMMRGARRFHRQLEHRAIQADGCITNGELRRVYADGETTCASIEVIACEGSLMPFVQFAASSQRQRMRWNHLTAAQPLARAGK